VAVSNEGATYSWGRNTEGQLGHGHVLPVLSATPIEALSHLTVTQAACGEAHSLILTNVNSTVYAMGRNKNGQLGLGHNSHNVVPRLGGYEAAPVQVHGLDGKGVFQLSCGANHSAAVAGT